MAARAAVGVVGDPVAVRVLAGEEARPARRAQRRRHERVRGTARPRGRGAGCSGPSRTDSRSRPSAGRRRGRRRCSGGGSRRPTPPARRGGWRERRPPCASFACAGRRRDRHPRPAAPGCSSRASAARARRPGTARKVTGSVASTPKRSVPMNRERASAPASPATRPEGRHRHPPAEHEREDARWRRPDREADPELARALAHLVGHDPVGADDAESEGEDREEAEQEHGEAAAGQGVVHALGHGPQAVDREVRDRARGPPA